MTNNHTKNKCKVKYDLKDYQWCNASVVKEIVMLPGTKGRSRRWSVQEEPMMNYTVKGLISFLSAYGTLGDEWRLMGCSNLTWCCLFGWKILGWSVEWCRKMSSRSNHLKKLFLVDFSL